MTGLDTQYPGDRAWDSFVQAIDSEWESCSVQKELLSAFEGDLGLASAVHWHLRENALNWLDTPVPALQGAMPRDCLKTIQGVQALKTLLMRMP